MADETQFATPDAFAEKIKTKYPEYKAIPSVELSKKVLAKYPEYWDHVDAGAFAKSGISRDGAAPSPQPPAATPPQQPSAQPPATPNWWQRAKANLPSWGEVKSDFKDIAKNPMNVFVGGGAVPGAIDTGEQQKAIVEGLKDPDSKVRANAQSALDLQRAGEEPAFGRLSTTKQFQKLLDPNSKSRTSRVLTGTTKVLEGLTSPDNIELLATLPMAPEDVGQLSSVYFGGQMTVAAAQGAKATYEAKKKGDVGGEWENGATTLLTALMARSSIKHGAGGAPVVAETHPSVRLDTAADEMFGEKFQNLPKEDKAAALWKALENSDPEFKKRVDAEYDRLAKSPGTSEGKTVADDVKDDTAFKARKIQEQQLRTRAAQDVMNQTIHRQLAAEGYRKAQAEAEAKIRKADEVTPAAEARGFSVTDRRSNTRGERGYITGTEREKYPVHAPGTSPEETSGTPVSDTRSVQDDPLTPTRASEIERPIQEFAEQQHGTSFSQLPLDQQQLVASHFEKSSPEQWQAFQQTQAYDAFKRHADAVERMQPAMNRWLTDHPEGTGEELQPSADAYGGVAQLLLTKGDVRTQLKEYPEVAKKLNEYSERTVGQSFDTTLRPKAALAGFLRENPGYLDILVNPDVAERLRTGQHIDLANMEAGLTDKQQVHTLMEFRDGTRRQMDEQFAGDVVRQEHAAIRDEMDRLVREAPAGETQRTDTIATQAAGLTSLAERINLDGITDKKDLFALDDAIQLIPQGDRTDEMRQFSQRVGQLRANVQNELIRRYRENMVADMARLSPEPVDAHTAPPLRQELYRQEGEHPTVTKARRLSDEAIAMVAREVVQLGEQRSAFQSLADNRSGEFATPEQKVEAKKLQESADILRQKQDAAIAAARDMQAPPKPIEPGPRVPAVMGRSTYVELNNGQRIPAHYAVVEGSRVIASHDPLNNFKPVPRFPQEAQPRDYENEPELQVGVHERANAPNPDILHSDTIRATDGPTTIMPDGVALSGNGREQGNRLAVSLGNMAPVYADLFEKAQRFGIDPEQIREHKDPRLVRILDEQITDPQELRRLGTEMNRDAGRGQSENEQRRALAGLLTPQLVDRFANIFRSVPEDFSLREAMRARAAALGNVLTESGMVDPTKRSAFIMDDGNLTEAAKEMIEKALAGRTVSSPEILGAASPSTVDKLGRASIDFNIMQSAGSIWDLASYNTDAVRLKTRAEDQSARLAELEGLGQHGDKEKGTYSAIERMLHPERFNLSNIEIVFDGQPTHPPVHPVVEALALALERKPKEYADMIGNYAADADRGGTTMFGSAEPWDAFNRHIGEKVGLEPVIPEEWGMVNGLPEAAKQVIEDARENGLPVEPSLHVERVESDVQPDTSSVEDAEKGNIPRTVADFRDALASHPDITGEQAAAISEILENVLPRAIGQTFSELLGNRRLSLGIGGREAGKRGYTEFIDNLNAKIHLFENANASTALHEVFHAIRPLLKPEHQKVLNEFVGAKPGAEWTVNQEEQAASAFERYHFDGGRRRGALEKAFGVINRAMQAVYDAASSMGLVKPSPEVAKMFDNWYDWERNERKPIVARNDIAEIQKKAEGGTVEIPKGAKVLDETAYVEKGAQNFVFTSKEQANDFIDKNSKTIRTYQLVDGKDGAFYVRASFQPGAKRLYQTSGASITDLARQAKEIEDRLKKTYDPREEARLRAQLNSIENRMGGVGLIRGGSSLRDDEVTQLIYGLGERPSVHEPTTPAQAMGEVQVYGDPTEVEVTANGNRDGRTLPDETAGLPESDGTEGVHERSGESDGRDEAAGRELPGRKRADGGRGKGISEPKLNPLAKMKGAELAAPKRDRGTPVADPAAWREYADALGLPEGTPPPTVRLPEDLRSLMIYPGQPEAIEVALSGLQQHDAVVVASPTGSGKTYLNLVIADQLLGNDSSKVGLVVTRSRNLIHGPDGYVDVGQKLGVQVEHLPGDINDVQGGGVYAATYAGIRGDQSLLQIPWDFVIFDESAEARKWNESAQGQAVVALGHAAKKVVYASATPFHTAIEVGYMHKLGLWPEGGFFEWARQFGVVETGPNSYTGGYAPKKLMKLRQQMIERGQWASLHQDMDGVSAHVAMVPMDAEARGGVKTIRNAFALAGKVFREQGRAALARATMAHETIYLKRYIESRRLPQVLDAAKKAIAEGWNPIIFSEYRSGTDKGMDFFNRLPPGVGEMVNKMLPPLPDIVEAVRGALGEDAAIFAGAANELREEERSAYMTGKKRAVYSTYAAGGIGANFNDRVGDRPRMGLFLGLPWSGIMFEQSKGRPWRYGTKSNVAMVFFSSDALPEMKVLATKILPRMRALNAAVYGEEMETHLSKMLRESSGIPEEMIDYEMGNEVAPSASEFETLGDGVHYTSYEDLKLPKAEAAKNKGMKYKAQPKRLYQSDGEKARFDFGSTQHDIPEDSEAGKALSQMRERIDPKDLMATGYGGNDKGLEDEPHVTVRFGLKGDDHDGVVAYLERQKPFEAKLGKVTSFPPGPRSGGGAPLISDVLSPELHRINSELGLHGDFAPSDFPEYKPHATIGYVKPEAAAKYVGDTTTEGKTFKVDRIAISDRNGNRTVVKLKGDENSRVTGYKRLYQDAKDLHNDANDAFETLPLDTLPPSMRRAVEANRLRTNAAAVEASKRAVPGVESPQDAIKRVTKDSVINSQLAYAAYDFKKNSRSFVQWAKEQDRIYNTAGDRGVWKYLEESGVPRAEAKDIARLMRLRKYKAVGYFGHIMKRVGDVTELYDVKTEQAHVVRVLEGKEPASSPRIQEAANAWRDLFADIRKKLGDAGAVFDSYDDKGKPAAIPWKEFRDNPNYWPHMWDWDQKMMLTGKDGKPHVTTLGELHDMEPGEQRDKMVAEYAGKHGLNKMEAEKFFSKNRRTMRLAPNLERTRDTNATNYDTSLRTIEIYAQQVAEMLANIDTVGQKREKINARIYILPTHAMKMADSIITGDLNPLSIGSDNQTALRIVTRAEILSKMGLSVFKLPGHALLKVPQLTSRWSTFVGGMNLTGEIAKAVLTNGRSKMEVIQMCREYGIFSDYVRQAMAMEYGLRAKEGIDRKLLKYTGFTGGSATSRAIGGAAARHWLTVHAQRALMKNPNDAVVRRRMSDVFAFSEQDLDRIAKEGINHEDVKQAMIAGAEWTTGGGRASEIPPYLRAGDDHPISSSMRTAARMAWTLRGFTFKTESLMNRLVFDELREGNVKPAINFLINAGLAGTATTLLQMGVNSVINKPSYDEQKRRFEALPDHKMGLIWMELSMASMAIGSYPLKIFFDHMGTYDAGDKKKAATQNRLAKDEANAISDEVGGIVLRDIMNGVEGAFEYMGTFEDDGINHRKTPEERRAEILHRMTTQAAPTTKPLFAIHDAVTSPNSAPATDFVPHRRAKHGKRHAVAQ